MTRAIGAMLVTLMLIGQSPAVTRGMIGVNFETGTMMSLLSSMYSSSSSMPVMGALGLRISPAEIIDIDVAYGVSILTEVEEDTAAGVDLDPSEVGHLISAGVVINPYEGEDALFGIYARFTAALSKISSTIEPATEPAFSVSYTEFTPTVGIGMEPSYYFSPNFGIFFRAGLGISFVPKSKNLQLKSGATGDKEDDYEWEDVEDDRVSIGTDGLSIGLRFLFGE